MAGLGLAIRDHGKQQDLPLFAWITRVLRDALVAKLSFVFNNALALGAGSPEEHERNRKAKLSTDLHARIAAFQRRTEALSVSVVYDASEDASFRGWPPPPQPSYLLPSLDERCSGMDLYPAVFCSPEWPHPQPQWPSVVAMLDGLRQRQRQSGVDSQGLSVVHFYDAGLDVTFFLARVCPPRLTAVIMFESTRNKQDSLVSALLKDVASVLSCSSALARLKPGAS